MTDLFTIALILVLYYWFFVRRAESALTAPQGLTDTVVDLNNTLRHPTSWTPIQDLDPERAWTGQQLADKFDYAVRPGDPLQIQAGGQVWSLPIPEGFRWDGDRLVETDDCYGQPDGHHVPATGLALYLHIRASNQNHPSRKAVRPGANPFYFSCRANAIERLHACEHPTYFLEDRCQPVNLCYGRKDGFRFADERDLTVYFECAQQKAVRSVCPPGTVFEENECRPPVDPCALRLDGYLYKIDRVRYAVCRNGVSIRKKCPPNRYFHEESCLPVICEGKLDGEAVGEPMDDGRLRFAPSYVVCSGGGIQSREVCPASWNRFEAEHALTHLPQVFDDGVCARPQLCRNVLPSDDQTVVPAYTYARSLGNWPQAERFDNVHGFRCDGAGQVQKVSVPAGLSIENFRIQNEPFCDRPKLVTALPDVYYDCTLRQTESCQPDTFFDGTECRPRIPDAFRFQHLDVFKYRLHVNNWMEPRDYSVDPEVRCEADEEYVHGRNLCVHVDCRGLAPVVADLKRALKLDDEFECVPDGPAIKKRRYEREVPELTLDFWNQRFVYGEASDCVVGERVRSDHFAYDMTLYKTCQPSQPFVFCPSSDTSHIERVGSSAYACVPKAKVYAYRLRAQVELSLYQNEVKSVEILTPNTGLEINGARRVFRAPENYTPASVNAKTLTLQSDQDVIVHFKTLVTNPETVYIQEGKLQHKAMPFVLPNDGTTAKPLAFQEYELEDSVTGFEL